MVKWRAVMAAALLVLAVLLLWSVFSPPEMPLSEPEVESEEPKGSWEEPVVQVVQQVGPSTVKIETTREVLVDQCFFQKLEILFKLFRFGKSSAINALQHRPSFIAATISTEQV